MRLHANARIGRVLAFWEFDSAAIRLKPRACVGEIIGMAKGGRYADAAWLGFSALVQWQPWRGS